MIDSLLLAAAQLRNDLDPVEFATLSGAAWREGACLPGCECAKRAINDAFSGEDLARLGLRLVDPNHSTLRELSGPTGTRRQRDLNVLLEVAAWELHPGLDDWCELARSCTRVRIGLSLYESRGSTGWDVPYMTGRAARRDILAEWLTRRAGRQRTPYAVRLRRAAQAYAREAAALRSACSEGTNGSGAERIALESAETAAWAGAVAVLEAALLGAGLPNELRAVLLEDLAEPVSPTSLRELVYIARAGRRALRVLAARRLAASSDRLGISTLSQLLWDPYPPLADTTLASLQLADRSACSRIVIATVRGMMEEDPAALRAPLLCAMAESLGDESQDLIAELATLDGERRFRPEVSAVAQSILGI